MAAEKANTKEEPMPEVVGDLGRLDFLHATGVFLPLFSEHWKRQVMVQQFNTATSVNFSTTVPDLKGLGHHFIAQWRRVEQEGTSK